MRLFPLLLFLKFMEMFLLDSSVLLKLVFAPHKCRDTFNLTVVFL